MFVRFARRALFGTLLFVCLFASAAAQTTRYESYPVEQLPFGCPIRFVDGVHVSGSDFLLVDTIDFNGHYLLLRRGLDERCWSTVDGIAVPQGWTAAVDAPDGEHCRLTLSGAGETRTYDFRFRPLMDEGDWELERYLIRRGEDRFEVFFPGLWRLEITEKRNGQTQHVHAAYYCQSDCANLALGDLPESVAQVRALEKEHPVAAIAPQNVSDRVNLREGPGTDHPRVGSLYSGVMVRIVGSADGEWLKVNPLAGATKEAYVKRTLLAFGEDIWLTPLAAQEWRLVSSGEMIPVDEHPFRSNDPLGFLPPGVPVSVIGHYNDDWAILGTWPGALYVESRYLQPMEAAQ